MKRVRTGTVVDNLHAIFAGREFVWYEKGEAIAEGIVLTVSNADALHVDRWTLEDKSDTRDCNISIQGTCWDEVTKSGILFLPPKNY
jgi:hypothetical protein